MMPASLLEDLFRRVDELARPVRFKRIPLPEPATEATPPAGGRLWHSPYALLFVCPVEAEHLERDHRRASYWLDDLLSEQEAAGRPMDGYLLLALECRPPEDQRHRARAIDQDPSFCRKHVLWPRSGDWQNRLERVTVLALAEIPSPAEPATIPELPARAEQAWKLYLKHDKVKTVTGIILDQVGPAGTGVVGE